MIIADKEINKAVNDIFDTNFKTNDNFLKNMQVDTLKRAFRKRVKQFHPDRARIVGVNESILTEKFKSINESYKLLLSIVKEGETIIQKTENKNENNTTQNHTKDHINKKESYRYANRYNKYNFKSKSSYDRYSYEKYKVKSFYSTSGIPNRRLRLSEYLFYSGLIDWHTMIRSIVWQLQVRPRFGEIARQFNFLSSEKIDIILKNVRAKEKFGDAAMRLGFIDLYKYNVILGRQKLYNNPIGKFLLKMEY